MGTSTGYEAPTDPQWSKLKGSVTRSSSAGAVGSGQARSVLRGFVRANGDAENMARGGGAIGRSRAGHRSARNLGGFVTSVSNRGLDDALREVGFGHLVGKSAGEVVHSLVDIMCDDGSLLDEVDARKAMRDLMKELLEGTTTYDEVKEALEGHLQIQRLGDLLFQFFGHYIYNQFIRVFYERVVQRRGQQKADKYFASIRRFISSALKHKTLNRDLTQVNWTGEQGATLVRQIHEQTLKVFAP